MADLPKKNISDEAALAALRQVLGIKNIVMKAFATDPQSLGDDVANSIYRGVINGIQSIQRAINAVPLNTYNNYEIRCYGKFITTTFEGMSVHEREYYSLVDLFGHNNITLIGEGKNETLLFADLPSVKGSSYGYAYYTTLTADCVNCKVKNMTIALKNGRYPVHIDTTAGTNYNKDSQIDFENVHFWHKGNSGDATEWTSYTPLGLGISASMKMDFKGCKFSSPTTGFYFHDGYSEEDYEIRHENSEFNVYNSTSANGVNLNLYGTAKGRGLIVFNGCRSNGRNGFILSTGANAVSNYLQIKGHGNSPMYFYNNVGNQSKSLRVTSSSTGALSSVRFTNTDSLFNTLISNGESATFEDEFERANSDGWIYKDGSLDLSGFANGLKKFKGEQLRSIIGNCSSVNKVLNIVVDGVNQVITLNLNYSAMTDANIIADINSKLTGAVADMWSVDSDYYPEFTDVVFIQKNVGTSAILRGMGVELSGTYIKRCNTGQPDYIAIDNIAVNGQGRVIKNAILDTSSRHKIAIKSGVSLAENAYLACENGYFIISAEKTNVKVIDKGGLKCFIKQ